jgi:snRNA-activating protein complex (SNAPc), subunit 3
MSEHICFPPINGSELASAFDLSWLRDDSEEAVSEITLDCDTISSRELIQLNNLHLLLNEEEDKIYLRLGDTVRDKDLVPRSEAHVVKDLLDRVMNAWFAFVNEHNIDSQASTTPWKGFDSGASNKRPAFLKKLKSALSSKNDERSVSQLPFRDPFDFYVSKLSASSEQSSAGSLTLDALSFPTEPVNPASQSSRIMKELLSDLPTVAELRAMQAQESSISKYVADCLKDSTEWRGADARQNSIRNDPTSLPLNEFDPSALIPSFLISFYDPFYVRKNAEFLVTTKNTLEELKDLFYCKSEFESDAAKNREASMFYIEGVLYDDKRPNKELKGTNGRKEYISDNILAWNHDSLLKGRASGWGILQSKTMKEQFGSIKPRLGAHYLYVHNGSCEHLIVFSDARLVPVVNEDDLREYPKKVFQTKFRKRSCQACSRMYATKMVFGDRYANTNPAYFCTSCYQLLHYDEEGKILYQDFQVFPYHHD